MIVLVRHGETDANRAGLLLGRADLPLNERGRQQAAAVAATLAHGAPPIAIVTSPLQRARATAAAISEATGAPVEVDERLIELDYGEWDEHTQRDIAPETAARWRANPDFAPPGGESLTDLRARVAPCATSLLERSADGLVVAVSHVSPIKAVILCALGLGDEYAWRLRLDVASISRVAPGFDDPVLVSFNETGHLR